MAHYALIMMWNDRWVIVATTKSLKACRDWDAYSAYVESLAYCALQHAI